MFGLLRLAMTLLICILAIGFYMGWFSFNQMPSDPQSNKVNINVSVDKNKVCNDLEKAEQNLSQRIQEANNQSKGSGASLPAGQPPAVPRLNFGPLSVHPSGGPPGVPGLSVGPILVQPSNPPPGQANGQPAGPPEYQFTMPLGVPPPGEGR